jgi:hypothetical protein
MVLEEERNGHVYEETFKKQYKAEFGVLLEEKNIIVDDIKVWRIVSLLFTMARVPIETNP